MSISLLHIGFGQSQKLVDVNAGFIMNNSVIYDATDYINGFNDQELEVIWLVSEMARLQIDVLLRPYRDESPIPPKSNEAVGVLIDKTDRLLGFVWRLPGKMDSKSMRP